MAAISGLSGNEIFCLRQQGMHPGDLVIGNSVTLKNGTYRKNRKFSPSFRSRWVRHGNSLAELAATIQAG